MEDPLYLEVNGNKGVGGGELRMSSQLVRSKTRVWPRSVDKRVSQYCKNTLQMKTEKCSVFGPRRS